MLDGTRREVFESLVDADRSATELADRLDRSVQTVYDHLESLREMGYIKQVGKRSGKTRPETLYTASEFGQIFAAFDGELLERNVTLTQTHKTMLSVLRVPQSEFHPLLFSYLFVSPNDWRGVKAIAVYGSVARGDADENSDIDVFHVVENGAEILDADRQALLVETQLQFAPRRLLSPEWFTERELENGREAGSQFLRNVFEEAIALYDPDGVFRDNNG